MDKQKLNNLEDKFFECSSKAMDSFLNGEPVDKDSLYVIVDAIRGIHHLSGIERQAGGGEPPAED